MAEDQLIFFVSLLCVKSNAGISHFAELKMGRRPMVFCVAADLLHPIKLATNCLPLDSLVTIPDLPQSPVSHVPFSLHFVLPQILPAQSPATLKDVLAIGFKANPPLSGRSFPGSAVMPIHIVSLQLFVTKIVLAQTADIKKLAQMKCFMFASEWKHNIRLL